MLTLIGGLTLISCGENVKLPEDGVNENIVYYNDSDAYQRIKWKADEDKDSNDIFMTIWTDDFSNQEYFDEFVKWWQYQDGRYIQLTNEPSIYKLELTKDDAKNINNFYIKQAIKLSNSCKVHILEKTLENFDDYLIFEIHFSNEDKRTIMYENINELFSRGKNCLSKKEIEQDGEHFLLIKPDLNIYFEKLEKIFNNTL